MDSLRRKLGEQEAAFRAELRTVAQNGEADAAVASMEAYSHASKAAEARLEALREELQGKLAEGAMETEALRRALGEARRKPAKADTSDAAAQTPADVAGKVRGCGRGCLTLKVSSEVQFIIVQMWRVRPATEHAVVHCTSSLSLHRMRRPLRATFHATPTLQSRRCEVGHDRRPPLAERRDAVSSFRAAQVAVRLSLRKLFTGG